MGWKNIFFKIFLFAAFELKEKNYPSFLSEYLHKNSEIDIVLGVYMWNILNGMKLKEDQVRARVVAQW